MTTELALPEIKQRPQPNQRQVAEAEKGIAEIQGQMTLAQRFPRDIDVSTHKVLKEMQRPSVAESALYSYEKGGKLVSGLSIRAAEAIMRSWGNMNAGWREIESEDKQSLVQVYAIDLEANCKVETEFMARHVRYGSAQEKEVTKSRDIYETVAAQATRRLRTCILRLIPVDVQEQAVAYVRATLQKLDESGDEPLEERVAKAVKALAQYDVTKEQIEDRLGHEIEDVTEGELVDLRGAYRAIRDGFTTAEALFGGRDAVEEASTEAVKASAKTSAKKTTPKRNSSGPKQTKPKPPTNQKTVTSVTSVTGPSPEEKVDSGALQEPEDGPWGGIPEDGEVLLGGLSTAMEGFMGRARGAVTDTEFKEIAEDAQKALDSTEFDQLYDFMMRKWRKLNPPKKQS